MVLPFVEAFFGVELQRGELTDHEALRRSTGIVATPLSDLLVGRVESSIGIHAGG